jgi:trehalose 6-phosphate synthase
MSTVSASGRLVCVSNRVHWTGSSLNHGVAVGIHAALMRTNGLWFGWDGELTDGEPGPVAVRLRRGIAHAGIALNRTEFHNYYNCYANEALWPLFHSMPSRFAFHTEGHRAYESVNRHFAQQLLPLLCDGDRLWVHDYHLIPLGRCLRKGGVRSPLGFFLHIPFPQIEVLRALPVFAELVRDLLEFDLVGFQTDSDLEAFLAACRHVFGDGFVEGRMIRICGRRVRADVFPIGVDVDRLQAKAAAAVTGEEVQRMLRSLGGRKLVMGVDRLDYTKGLIERFSAYEQFLGSRSDDCERLTYLQIASLSRKDVRAYAAIRQTLEQAAGRINGRFGDTNWTPIRYLNRNMPHDVLLGTLRSARVGLVTPLRDGMNLVAKEYLAVQDASDPGVLILSNLAGAAVELSAAIQVNPYDPDALGRALTRALTMPLDERRDRHGMLLARLRQSSIAVWAERFELALAQEAFQ